MSWFEVLRDTYDACVASPIVGAHPLEPISHTTQQAHIEVAITGAGVFRRARVLDKVEAATLVPCTEGSSGRSGSRPVHHPLCDKLQYLAADFVAFGGEVTVGFAKSPHEPHVAYMADLSAWASSRQGHPSVSAIHAYLSKGQLMSDLAATQVLPLNAAGDQALPQWLGDKDKTPAIFKVIQKTQSPTEAFVRWVVEHHGKAQAETWADTSLQAAWARHYETLVSLKGLCMVTGETVALALQHPAKLRHGADKAKLISSNDTSGYTYRGRFADGAQALAVGYESTQKAHNALRWLIARQGQRIGGEGMVVAWAKAGAPVPDPLANTAMLMGLVNDAPELNLSVGDFGQTVARQLNRAIAGFRSNLKDLDQVIVLVIDAATPGRSAISYYRELVASDFLARIERWHTLLAWHQDFGKDKRFLGAPSPRDIAEAAFGARADDRLRKATVERLLPCIVDGQSIPRDLVMSVVRRASNRVGLEHWEWERCLGIACSLVKGYETERNYSMALEEDRQERDYLFGRLLAIAEQVERSALRVANEKRDTNAARLMQRFADRPSSTWRTIALSLNPYWSRLTANKPGTAHFLKVRLDAIVNLFAVDDFVSDKALGSGFLIGYHCQRQALWSRHSQDVGETDAHDGVTP